MSSLSDLAAFQFARFAIAAWVILVIALIFVVARLEHLNAENRARIVEIQRSRLDSCEQTYQSFHVIFDPFLPPKKNRTAKQKSDLRKFNAIIARKIAACQDQV